MSILIRPATIADCPAIMDIYNHYVRTDTCTYQEEDDTLPEREAWFERHGSQHPIFVATDDENVVGWGSLSPFHPRSAYRFTVENSVYLRHGQQGRGIGRRLMETLLVAARERGHQQMVALISSEQAASIGLHATLGFRQVGHISDVGLKFGRWLSVDFWQLDLR